MAGSHIFGFAEDADHAESDATVIEISYSIRLSFCHSISFHSKLTIRNAIQTDRNETGYKKACAVWKDDRAAALLLTARLFKPLGTKRRLIHLKMQFVPHSKHFSSRL